MAMSKEAKAGMAGAVVLGVLIFVALYAFGAAAPGNEASGPPFPSGADCPSAEQAQRFDQTGAATTDYVDAPTGRLLLSYEFPDAPGGRDILPRREAGARIERGREAARDIGGLARSISRPSQKTRARYFSRTFRGATGSASRRATQARGTS